MNEWHFKLSERWVLKALYPDKELPEAFQDIIDNYDESKDEAEYDHEMVAVIFAQAYSEVVSNQPPTLPLHNEDYEGYDEEKDGCIPLWH